MLAFSAGAATKTENNKHTPPKKLVDVTSGCPEQYIRKNVTKKDILALTQKLGAYGDYSTYEAALILDSFLVRIALEACKAKIIQSLSEEKAMGAMRFWDETN